MFLDDQLYDIAKSVNMNDSESIKSTLNSMVKKAFGYIEDQSKLDGQNFSVVACFHRVDKYWRDTAYKLNKNNIPLVEPNGFKLLCQSKEQFKGIF